MFCSIKATMAYYRDINLQPSLNDGCVNQHSSEINLKDCFSEKFSIKNQFRMLYHNEDDSSINLSNLNNKIKILTRYIEDAPRKKKQTIEFAKDVSRKLFFIKEDVNLFVKHEGKFPFCQDLHSLLVRYVEFEYDILYNSNNFSMRYQKVVEKRVLHLLLSILYDTYGVTKKLVSTPVEASAMNSLFILKSVQDRYKQPKNIIENMMVKLLRKLNILEEISEMKNKNKTLNYDQLSQVLQVRKMQEYLQNRDCEEAQSDDDSNENMKEIPPIKSEIKVEEIDRKFDISSCSSRNEECFIIDLDSEDEDDEENRINPKNDSKYKKSEISCNNRFNSRSCNVNSFATSDNCDIEKLYTNYDTSNTSFVSSNENYLSSMSRVSRHINVYNKLKSVTNKSNSSHSTNQNKTRSKRPDASANGNFAYLIFEDKEYENPLLKRELLLLDNVDYLCIPSKLYDIALTLKRHINDAPKPIRYKMKFVQGIHRTILYLYENTCRYIKVNKQFLSSLELHVLLVSYVELEYEGLYNSTNYSEKYEKVVENRILQLLLTVLYDPKNTNDVVDNPADTSAMNALYVLRSVKVEYKRCQPLIENMMTKLLRKLGVLDKVNQLRCKNNQVNLENLLKFPQFQKIYEYLKSRDLYRVDECNPYEDEMDEIVMVSASEVKCEPKQESPPSPPETPKDIIIDLDEEEEEDDDCVMICFKPNILKVETNETPTTEVLTSQIYRSNVSIDTISQSANKEVLSTSVLVDDINSSDEDIQIVSDNVDSQKIVSSDSCDTYNIENEDEILNKYACDDENNLHEISEESVLNCSINSAGNKSNDESLTNTAIEIIDKDVTHDEEPLNLTAKFTRNEEENIEETDDFSNEISNCTCLETLVVENNKEIEILDSRLVGSDLEASCIEKKKESSEINVIQENTTTEEEICPAVEACSNEPFVPEIATIEETASETVSASLESNEADTTNDFAENQQSVIVHTKTSLNDVTISHSNSLQEYQNTDEEVSTSYHSVNLQIENKPNTTSNNVTEELNSQSVVFETPSYDGVITDEPNDSLNIIDSRETYKSSCNVDVVLDDVQTSINDTQDMQSHLISDTNSSFNTQDNSLDVLAQLASEREKISDSGDVISKKNKNKKMKKPKKNVTETRVTRSTVIKESTNLKVSNINCSPSDFINLESLVTPAPNRVCDLISNDFIINEESTDGLDTYTENESTTYNDNQLFSFRNPIFDEDTIEDGVVFVCHTKKNKATNIKEIEVKAKMNESLLEYSEINLVNEFENCNSIKDYIPVMDQANVISISDHELESYNVEVEIQTFISEQIHQEIFTQNATQSINKNEPVKKKKFRYSDINTHLHFVKPRTKKLRSTMLNTQNKLFIKETVDTLNMSTRENHDTRLSGDLETNTVDAKEDEVMKSTVTNFEENSTTNFERLENVPTEPSVNDKDVASIHDDDVSSGECLPLSQIVSVPDKEILNNEDCTGDLTADSVEKQTCSKATVESENNIAVTEILQCEQITSEEEITIAEDYGCEMSSNNSSATAEESVSHLLEVSSTEKVLHSNDEEVTKNTVCEEIELAVEEELVVSETQGSEVNDDVTNKNLEDANTSSEITPVVSDVQIESTVQNETFKDDVVVPPTVSDVQIDLTNQHETSEDDVISPTVFDVQIDLTNQHETSEDDVISPTVSDVQIDLTNQYETSEDDVISPTVSDVQIELTNTNETSKNDFVVPPTVSDVQIELTNPKETSKSDVVVPPTVSDVQINLTNQHETAEDDVISPTVSDVQIELTNPKETSKSDVVVPPTVSDVQIDLTNQHETSEYDVISPTVSDVQIELTNEHEASENDVISPTASDVHIELKNRQQASKDDIVVAPTFVSDVQIPNYEAPIQSEAFEDDVVICEYQEEVIGTDNETFENSEIVKDVENVTEIETTQFTAQDQIMPTLDKVDLQIQQNQTSEYGCPLLLAYEFDNVAEEVIETSSTFQEDELSEECQKKVEVIQEIENKPVDVTVKKVRTKAAKKEFHYNRVPYIHLERLPAKYMEQLIRAAKLKNSFKSPKEQMDEKVKPQPVVVKCNNESLNKRVKSFSKALEEVDRCTRDVTRKNRTKRTRSHQEDGGKLESKTSKSFESTSPSSNDSEDFDKSYKHKKELAKVKMNKKEKVTSSETINERNLKKSTLGKILEPKRLELTISELEVEKKSKHERKSLSPAIAKEKVVEGKISGKVDKSKLKLTKPPIEADIQTYKNKSKPKLLEKSHPNETCKSVADYVMRESKSRSKEIHDEDNNRLKKRLERVEVEKVKQKTEKEIMKFDKSDALKISLTKNNSFKDHKTKRDTVEENSNKSRRLSTNKEAKIDKKEELVFNNEVVEEQKLDSASVMGIEDKTDKSSLAISTEVENPCNATGDQREPVSLVSPGSPKGISKNESEILKSTSEVPPINDLNVSTESCEVQHIYLNDVSSPKEKQNVTEFNYKEILESVSSFQVGENSKQLIKHKKDNIERRSPMIKSSPHSKCDIENDLVEYRIPKKRKSLLLETFEGETLNESKLKCDFKPKGVDVIVENLKTIKASDKMDQEVIEDGVGNVKSAELPEVDNSIKIADTSVLNDKEVEITTITNEEILPLTIEEINGQKDFYEVNKVVENKIEREDEALIKSMPNLPLEVEKSVERPISVEKFAPALENRECKAFELETEKVIEALAETIDLTTNTIHDVPMQCESIEECDSFDKSLASTSKQVAIDCNVFTPNPKNLQHPTVESGLMKNVPPTQILEEIVESDNLLNSKDFVPYSDDLKDTMNDDCLLQIASEPIVETTRVPPSTSLTDNCETSFIQAMFSQVTQNRSNITGFIYFTGSDHNYHSERDPLLSAECSKGESGHSSAGIKKIPTPELDNEDNILQYITTHSEPNLNQELPTALNKTSVNSTSAFQFLDQCLIDNTLSHESSPPLPQRASCVNDFRQNLKQEVVAYEDNNSTSLEFVPESNEVDLTSFQQTEISTENMQELMNSVLTEIVNLNAISAMKTDVPKSNSADCDYNNYKLVLQYPESTIKPYKDLSVGNVPLINKSDTSTKFTQQVPNMTTIDAVDHSDVIANCISKTMDFEPDFSNFYLPVIQDTFPITNNSNFNKKVIVEHIVPPEMSKVSCDFSQNSPIKPTTTNLLTTTSRSSKSNVYNPTTQLEFYKSKLQNSSKSSKSVVDNKPNLSDCLTRRRTRTKVLAPEPRNQSKEPITVPERAKEVKKYIADDATNKNQRKEPVVALESAKEVKKYIADATASTNKNLAKEPSTVTKEVKKHVADATVSPNKHQTKELISVPERAVTKEVKKYIADATVAPNKRIAHKIVSSKDQSSSLGDLAQTRSIPKKKDPLLDKKKLDCSMKNSTRPVKAVTSFLDDLNKLDVQNQSKVQPTKVTKTVDSQSQTIDIASTDTLQGKTKDFSFEQAISRNDMIDNIKCRSRKRVNYLEKPDPSPAKKPLNLHDKLPYKGNQKKIDELRGKRKLETLDDKDNKLEKNKSHTYLDNDSDKAKVASFYDSDSGSSPKKKKSKLSLPEPTTIDAIFDRLRKEGNINENNKNPTCVKNTNKSTRTVSLPSYDHLKPSGTQSLDYDQPTSTSNNISMGNIFNTGSQRTSDNKPKKIAIVAPIPSTAKNNPPYVRPNIHTRSEDYHNAKSHHAYSSRSGHYAPHSVREPFLSRHQEGGTRRSEYQPDTNDRRYASQNSRANNLQSTSNLDWIEKMKNAFPQEFNNEISFDCGASSRSGR